MTRRTALAGIVLLVLILAVTGCSSQAPSAQKPAEQKPAEQKPAEQKPAEKPKASNLILVTGPQTGVYYPIGGGIGTAVNKMFPEITMNNQVGSGSIGNIRLLKQKEVDIAMCGTNSAFYALKGIEQFPNEPMPNIRMLGILYPQPMQLCVRAESSVKTFPDLKGKRAAVGAPGSGDEACFRDVCNYYGLKYPNDFDIKKISLTEQVGAMKDRQIDSMWFVGGVPSSAFLDVGSQAKIRFIPFPDADAEGIIKLYPFYSKSPIPANTYPGQNEAVPSLAIPGMLIVREDMDADIVYKITKAVYESHEDLILSHKMAEDIKLETALSSRPVPLHPGAEKYFKEKGLIK